MSIKRNSIYPTMPSLDTVILKAYSELPITDKNQLYAIIMTYHNTLLNQLKEESNEDSTRGT